MLSITKYLFIAFCFTVILHTNALAQKLDIKNVEHISLITDRTLYISGEPIWYSASYSIPTNNLLALSKVLYVELFNSESQKIASQKIVIDNDVITGRILIPEHVATGYYILRAYTRYQENFPPWQYTSVIVSVVNPIHPLPASPLPSGISQTRIGFMSNGNIAYQIKEPLAKKIDSIRLLINGMYFPAKGSYYSNGLGSFNYKATPKDSISLLITLKSGDSIISETYLTDSATEKIPFKDVYAEFSLLSIKSSKGNNLVQPDNSTLKEVSYQKNIIANNSVFSGDPISVNLSDIDSSYYPLAISMVIKGSNNYSSHLLPNYIIENPLYIDGYLSRCVYIDEDLLNQLHIIIALEQENLFTLFNEDYKIKNFIIPEFSSLTLSGKLKYEQTNKAAQNKLVYTSILGNEPQFHVTKTSLDGSFTIPLNFCNNQQDIYIATNISNKNKLDIQINDGFSSNPPPWHSSPFIPDTSLREIITQMYMNHQIVDAFNIQRLQTDEIIKVNRPIFGDNLTKIKLSDYIQMSTTPEVFNELVPNVRARKKDGHYSLVVFDDDINLKYENPLIIVDYVLYNDIDRLMELQPTEIEQIDVINHEYAYGNNLFKGIIMITTNTRNFAKLPLSKSGVFVEYQTITPNVKFVPFSYSQGISDKPNFANTVYWESFNYDAKVMQLQITAPSSIAEYELFVISLGDKPKIIEFQNIRVNKKPTVN